MKRIFRLAVCLALCFSLFTAGVGTLPTSAADFDDKAEMLHIADHIEHDAGLNEYATVQGACSDGKYAYFAFMQGAVCNIARFNARSWEYIEKKQIVNMGHSNDMTYNEDKDYLVVVNNVPYYDVVTLVSTKTLEPIKDVKLKEDIYSIAYNASRKTYVVGISGTYDFALLDANFKVKKKFKGVNTGYTRQGCDCDDDYIYFVQSGSKNILVVYDYAGNHVATIPIDDNDEIENIFHIGSEYYTSLFYYGSTLYRIGFSPSSRISYKVSYDANGGGGEMKPTTVKYGKKTKLSPCTFTRDGYFFAGWRAQRTMDDKVLGYRNGSSEFDWVDADEVFNYQLYDDEETVSSTVKFGGVKMTAQWIAENYTIETNCGDGEGNAQYGYIGYDEAYTLPEEGFSKEGFILEGYAATRSADDRAYGYRKGSDKPEWLYPSDVAQPYIFKPGESVKKMTYDGSVTMAAQYKYAYTFDDSGSTLIEYAGVDEKVTIPDNDGELTTLAEGAFKDNEIITDLVIPAGVNELSKNAVSNCPNLNSVYFEGAIPRHIDSESFANESASAVYEVFSDQTVFMGFIGGKQSLSMLRGYESALRHLQEYKTSLS